PLVSRGARASGSESCKATGKARLPATGFDDAFNRVLHDGLLANSALPAVALASVGGTVAAPPAHTAGAGGLALVFRPSPALYDGRFANIGWLQELPDAVTKMTWGNAALLSPKTAKDLHLENEDGVRERFARAE